MRQYNKERYVFIPFHLFIYWLSRNDCFIGIAIFMYVYLAPDQRPKKLPIYRRSVASVVGPGDTPASLSVFTAAMTRMFMQTFCYRTHTHTHKSYVQICEPDNNNEDRPKNEPPPQSNRTSVAHMAEEGLLLLFIGRPPNHFLAKTFKYFCLCAGGSIRAKEWRTLYDKTF